MPITLKHIKQQRGLAGYYQQYIKGFSKEIEPLNQLLRKKEFIQIRKEQKAFDYIKFKF